MIKPSMHIPREGGLSLHLTDLKMSVLNKLFINLQSVHGCAYALFKLSIDLLDEHFKVENKSPEMFAHLRALNNHLDPHVSLGVFLARFAQGIFITQSEASDRYIKVATAHLKESEAFAVDHFDMTLENIQRSVILLSNSLKIKTPKLSLLTTVHPDVVKTNSAASKLEKIYEKLQKPMTEEEFLELCAWINLPQQSKMPVEIPSYVMLNRITESTLWPDLSTMHLKEKDQESHEAPSLPLKSPRGLYYKSRMTLESNHERNTSIESVDPLLDPKRIQPRA